MCVRDKLLGSQSFGSLRGRTGRADKRGIAFTFVNSADEAKFAPFVVRALTEAGQAENISPALKELSDSFKERVKRAG